MEIQVNREKGPDGSEMHIPIWNEGVQGGQNALPYQPNREEH